jgi:RNA polymerase sigma-70 factor (ECF subfamily)
MSARSENGLNPGADAASKAQDAARARQHDRDLIARAGDGDIRAFEELVQRHQRRANTVAYGIVRSAEDAREVTQDAFLRVHRHLKDFEGGASFSTWLYRIVYNLSIDLIRRRSPGRAVEFEDHTDLTGAPDEWLPARGELDPFAALDRTRLVEAMQRCLDELPPHHRTAIVLREVEGLSYEEIAEAMEVPKGTVMSRLFHARRKMQKMLREHFGDEVPRTAEERDGEETP